MTKQRPVVVVGSINMDVVATTQTIPAIGETVIGTSLHYHPGGKGANQAVAVARLGYPVQLIGCLGNDPFATQLRTSLEQAGVDTHAVTDRQGSSGVALIVVSAAGENSIVVTPGANGTLSPEDLDAHLDILRAASVVLTQLEIPVPTVEHLADICAREHIPLILDPAPGQVLTPSVIEKVAWFTPNETEAAFFSAPTGPTRLTPGQTASAILAHGCHGVILKLGSEGAVLASQESAPTIISSFRVQAIDTTAAGDAFNGGFATGLSLGQSALESAAFASAVAALSVTRMGAQPSMPTRAEVDTFLKQQTGQTKPTASPSDPARFG